MWAEAARGGEGPGRLEAFELGGPFDGSGGDAVKGAADDARDVRLGEAAKADGELGLDVEGLGGGAPLSGRGGEGGGEEARGSAVGDEGGVGGDVGDEVVQLGRGVSAVVS